MLNERKIQLTRTFDYVSDDGTEMYLPSMSWVDAVDVQGQTLVRVAFGSWRPIYSGYQEDDLKDVLEKNTHLTRSDFM